MGEKEHLQANIYIYGCATDEPAQSIKKKKKKKKKKREREEEENQPKAGKMKERILFLKYATYPSAAKRMEEHGTFPEKPFCLKSFQKLETVPGYTGNIYRMNGRCFTGPHQLEFQKASI